MPGCTWHMLCRPCLYVTHSSCFGVVCVYLWCCCMYVLLCVCHFLGLVCELAVKNGSVPWLLVEKLGHIGLMPFVDWSVPFVVKLISIGCGSAGHIQGKVSWWDPAAPYAYAHALCYTGLGALWRSLLSRHLKCTRSLISFPLDKQQSCVCPGPGGHH